MLYPFLFAFLGMFVSVEGFYEVSVLPIPESAKYMIENFQKIFARKEIYRSVIVTLLRFVWYTALLSLTSVLGGYVFAKVNFGGKKIAFYLLMSSMMIPGVAMLTPQYLMFSKMSLTGKPAILFITGCFSAYNIFLVRQTLTGLGDEYKEARNRLKHENIDISMDIETIKKNIFIKFCYITRCTQLVQMIDFLMCFTYR